MGHRGGAVVCQSMKRRTTLSLRIVFKNDFRRHAVRVKTEFTARRKRNRDASPLHHVHENRYCRLWWDRHATENVYGSGANVWVATPNSVPHGRDFDIGVLGQDAQDAKADRARVR